MINIPSAYVPIMNGFVDQPFATTPQLSRQLGKSKGYVGQVFHRICEANKWEYLPTISQKLYIFDKLGWLNTDSVNLSHGIVEIGNIDALSLFYLKQHPYADSYMVRDHFDITYHGAKQRMYRLYSTFGVTGLSTPRLRMYYKLGWYRPFKLEVS